MSDFSRALALGVVLVAAGISLLPVAYMFPVDVRVLFSLPIAAGICFGGGFLGMAIAIWIDG